MNTDLRFEILGPVRGWHENTELDLGSPQQRAVLAILLLSPGWQVSVNLLIDAIWGEDPPRAAPGTVRTYISRLRHLLDSVTGNQAAELIKSIGGGYTLLPGSVTVDLDLFTRRVEEAREARSGKDTALAATLLREALALWRGMPLAGVQGPYADAQRTRLTEVHMAVTEERLAMDIESGDHKATIAELQALRTEYPLREKLGELLMLALYRAGRQADALSVFADERRLLRDELGIDPGPGLRDMHERILRADRTLIVKPAAKTGISGAKGNVQIETRGEAREKLQDRPAELPAQLPPSHADFTGRADTVRAIVEALKDVAGAPVVTITGMPGIGKTALAVQAARAVLDAFPDGQLYADLGAASGNPADPAAVLAGFLRELGHDSGSTSAALPGTAEELASAYRSALAGRRMVVVLDDARDTAQVRHLLPGLRGCAVIVTTQRRMIDLPGARWFEISGLRPEESVRLLARVAGRGRVAAERVAALRVGVACAGQPVAIRTVGARLAARPGWRIMTMVRLLERELTPQGITHPDCEVVQAPFELAHRQLTAEQAFVFRQAATSDSPEISVSAVADLMGAPRNTALKLLESLADAHLIEADAFGSYRYDPLVKLFAGRRALAEDGVQTCESSRALLDRHSADASIAPWPALTSSP
jgi:DNA-binding SARP family transcriptional activator